MIKFNGNVHRKKTSKSNFIRKNIKNYISHSTPKELKFDMIFPLIISLLITVLVFFVTPSPRDFTLLIYEINGIAITITAILAGFNTASLAIIASAGNFSTDSEDFDNYNETHQLKGIKKIKALIFNNPSAKEVDAVVSFFAYAVISQLMILVGSLVLNVVLSSILKNTVVLPSIAIKIKMIILTPLSFIWLLLILHSIFLSIRNIDMISHFIKFNSKH